MIFKKDEIVFLMGAGASVDAKIPTSCGMIEAIEKLLTDNIWKEYTSLYNFVKSAIVYADGIQGKFDNSNFNIERLVNTLDELLKSDKHPIFPFIGSWTPKLPEVSGNDFSKIISFRKKIVEQLSQHWVRLEYDEDAKYYAGLSRFQQEYQYPLRVFTLNYDLCIEKACSESGVERGFGDGKQWDWRIFDNEEQISSSIFLYKLHGSVDWTRDNNGCLTYKDRNISPDNIEIIFGTSYKLQYIDPFLFFAYEFRKRTLSEAKIIICIGYGFGDEHINGIITQALNNNKDRKLLIISPSKEPTEEARRIGKILGLEVKDNIIHQNLSAKEYLNQILSVTNLQKVFPEKEPPFEELLR
jgi:hypothetical protein